MTVTVTRSGLRIDETIVPLLSGAVHYWRLERRRWAACLDAVSALGLSIVETYVPWNVHEERPGVHDFGRVDPRKDLGAFLDLAAERGLYAIVRPGPHINAELTYFGYPERILRDESILARSARGTPVLLPVPPRMFPVPSYASDRFFAEVERWYAAVAEVVAPRKHPNGPVVLVQVDNEAALFFRDGLFEQDYHPDAIALYRSRLAERRGQPSDDVEPPRKLAIAQACDLVPLLEWAEFQEELPRQALERLRQALERVGLGGIPTSHNVPPGQWGVPMSIPALEGVVDIVGIDLYSPRWDHRTLKQRLLLLSGTARLPYSPELGSGAPPWYPQVEPEDARFLAMMAMAYGLKGYNLYMAVDRDRWIGAPIDARGEPTGMAPLYRRLHEAFRQHRLHMLERKLGALVVVPREYARLSRVAHCWGPMSPSVLEQLGLGPRVSCLEGTFGFPEPVQIAWTDALNAFSLALEQAFVPYGYLDGDADQDRFIRAPILCVPCFDFLDQRLCDKLNYAAGRGIEVICSPRLPTLDERMRPLGRSVVGVEVADYRGEQALRDRITELAVASGARTSVRTSAKDVDVTVLEAESRRVVFVVRRAKDACTAELQVDGELGAQIDAFTGEAVDPGRVPLDGFQVRMLTSEAGHQ